MSMSILIFKDLYIDGYKEKQRVLCCSYSQIDVFLQCSYRWYLSYIKGLRKQIKSEPLDLGSSIHITLQDYYDAVKDGKEWTLGESVDLLDMNMDIQDIPYIDEESKRIAIEQHHKMISGIVSGDNKLAKLIKGKQIIATEKEFQYKLDLPFKVKYGNEIYDCIYIIGSIDLIIKDGDSGYIVIDYKSGKKEFESKKLKSNLQLPIYSLVVKDIYGKLPIRTLYYFTRLDIIQEVQVPALNNESAITEYYKNGNVKSVQRTVDDIINELLGIFEQMYTTGEYKPANQTPLCCWCDYHLRYGDNSCKYGNETYWRKDIKAIRY